MNIVFKLDSYIFKALFPGLNISESTLYKHTMMVLYPPISFYSYLVNLLNI